MSRHRFFRSGTLKFQVGTTTMQLGAGDSLFVAQDTPHAFVKTSDGVARLIAMHQPATTMEEYFRTVIGRADRTVEGRRRSPSAPACGFSMMG